MFGLYSNLAICDTLYHNKVCNCCKQIYWSMTTLKTLKCQIVWIISRNIYILVSIQVMRIDSAYIFIQLVQSMSIHTIKLYNIFLFVSFICDTTFKISIGSIGSTDMYAIVIMYHSCILLKKYNCNITIIFCIFALICSIVLKDANLTPIAFVLCKFVMFGFSTLFMINLIVFAMIVCTIY